MSSTLWIMAGAVALLAVLWRVLAPSLDRDVQRAIRARDAAPLIAALSALSPGRRPDAFNHAIRRLWDRYERALAVPVVRALAEQHPNEPIAQYWLEQARTVEPELAREVLDPEFLRAHYRPWIAATCGEAG